MTPEQVNNLESSKDVSLREQSTQTDSSMSSEEIIREEETSNEGKDTDISLPDPPSDFVNKYFKSLTAGKTNRKRKKNVKKGNSNLRVSDQEWIVLN